MQPVKASRVVLALRFTVLIDLVSLGLPLIGDCRAPVLLLAWAYARILPYSFRPSYYQIEQSVFHRLGVRRFQRLLRTISRFNPAFRQMAGKRQLRHLEQATRAAETAHAVIFVIIMGFTIYSPSMVGCGAVVSALQHAA